MYSHELRSMGATLFSVIISIVLLLPAFALASSQLAEDHKQRLLSPFGEEASLGEWNADHKVWPIEVQGEVVGYGFETIDQFNIPAYSGKPINILLALDLEGVIRRAWVLSHHEPILLVGIPEKKLWDFAQQYEALTITDHIRVGHSTAEQSKTIDAVTGATVTVMVVHETILRSAKKVARAMGLKAVAASPQSRASVKQEFYQPASWAELTGDGSIRRLMLDQAEVDKAFENTQGMRHRRGRSEEEAQETFIDLYYGYLNVPSIGRNLLGDSEYRWLMDELGPDDHAIAVLANGEYSFKGSGYVRGGIFDRLQLSQDGIQISFRDVDYYRLSDVYAAGMPEFSEMAIFIVRDNYQFNPAAPWQIELLVRRQTGPVESIFVTFEGQYQLPDYLLVQPDPVAADLEVDQPMWVGIWQQRSFQIGVLLVSLLLLTGIIFLQDWLVRYPRLLHNLRRGFLIYTVFFLGWYALGQLSIVNVLTFTHALMGEFRWELFLMDPLIFILWGFTAATIVLWGRGIFCGWLCPFGALQELINELARKLKIKQFEPPFAVHERLWAVKYIILLALFGISLESMATAERYAEVEPFKTTFFLVFQREWWFATWALLLLFVSLFTRKVYCRYICPLGAALAIPTKLRLFDWLKRRKECGSPCQLCAVECEIQAIHPDGTINANECHHCLDCQMTYHNPNKCPPLINKAKQRKSKPKPEHLIETVNT